MADQNIPTLEGADLAQYNEQNPMRFTIVEARDEVMKDFRSNEDVEKLVVYIENEIGQLRWIPNAKSTKRLLFAFGKDRENWKGKAVDLWTVKKDVFGNMKDVIYPSIPKQE